MSLGSRARTSPERLADTVRNESRQLRFLSKNGSLVAIGFETQTGTPEEFAQLIVRERARMARLVRDAGLKSDQ